MTKSVGWPPLGPVPEWNWPLFGQTSPLSVLEDPEGEQCRSNDSGFPTHGANGSMLGLISLTETEEMQMCKCFKCCEQFMTG